MILERLVVEGSTWQVGPRGKLGPGLQVKSEIPGHTARVGGKCWAGCLSQREGWAPG